MGFEEPRVPEIDPEEKEERKKAEEKKEGKKAIVEDGMMLREDGIWEDLETGEEMEDIEGR